MIGIVLCHKRLAFELVETATAILGHHEGLFAFTNDKLDAEELVQKLNEFLNSVGNPGNAILMVDLRGGNCWTIARLISRNRPGFKVISGANLPMLLSFLTKKDSQPAIELSQIIENDAKRGMMLEN